MEVRFWGTRGSVARPHPGTLRYGGNTSCVEVRADDGTLLVVDCGTGSYPLGASLVREAEGPRLGHLLIGHTHWDHIQGFPFFAPFFDPSHEWHVYAPGGRARQIEESLGSLMSYDFHPMTLGSLDAEVAFHDLREGEFEIGPFHITTQYLHHPALTLGYRIEADGATLVYASDHEPHSLYPQSDRVGQPPLHHEDRRHVRFLRDADLVIHDAQYTLDEFAQHAGWGHTPVERAVDYAVAAGVRQLALFHHDPSHDDDTMDRIVESASERASRAEHVPEVVAAMEGQGVRLVGEERTAIRANDRTSALLPKSPPRVSTVLIVDSDRNLVDLFRTALRPEGVRLLTAALGKEGVQLARSERPTLMLLDARLPDADGLEVCRELRADPDPHVRDMPILILTGSPLADLDMVEAFRAGATDFLTKPIKPTLVRARVRGWLMRGGL